MDGRTVGARIAQRRREKSMTQEALAQLLDVSNQAVSKWEGEVCCPDIQLLPDLCDAPGMTLDELFGRKAPQIEPPQPDLLITADLPWDDDDDLHAVLFPGHRLLRGRERFRQEYDEVRRSVTLHFTSPVKEIYSDFSITCPDSVISGDVKADGDISCGMVGGDVHAGKSVTCGDVQGDANAVTVRRS